MVTPERLANQLMAIAMYRAYLAGHTYNRVAKDFGFASGAPVKNCIRKLKGLVAHYANKFNWEPRVDWARDGADIQASDRDRSAMWLVFLATYETELHIWAKEHEDEFKPIRERAIARELEAKRLKEERNAPRAPCIPIAPTEEELARDKYTRTLRHIDWYRLVLDGQTPRVIAKAENISQTRVTEAIKEIKELLLQKGFLGQVYRQGVRQLPDNLPPYQILAALDRLVPTIPNPFPAEETQ